MLGTLGVLFALGVLIFLALYGYNILVASLIAGGIVAVTNAPSWSHALAVDYTAAMFGFAANFFILFLTGAIFGRVMAESGAAQSIAMALRRVFGDERALLVIVLATAGLTYGGVNTFIVVFSLYPLAIGLLHRANLPKRLLVGAAALGAGTFTMTALPASPSIHNNISANALGTPLTASPWLGLLAGGIMLGLGMLYLNWQRRVAIARGEVFVPGPQDLVVEVKEDAGAAVHWVVAALPLLLVVSIILLPRFLMGPVLGTPPGAPETFNALQRTLAFSNASPIMWTCIALTLGILLGTVLFYRFLPDLRGVIGRGAENSALPLLNTAAVIGFGGVVQKTAIFESFATYFLQSELPPLAAAAISVNVISGIVGSASGGLQIWMVSFAPHYIAAGVDPAVLHRVITVASGAFDSLPHCGAIITFLTVTGVTHREGYKDIAALTIVVPAIATVVLVLLGTWLG